MARPRVFVSSTFYDLKHIRSFLESFIGELGYEPVLEKNVAYDPDIALDESCYREAQSCDIFVLVIGGRYGSPASIEKNAEARGFYDRYQSITRREYESAIERDIPAYILIEKAVYVEYTTYKKNPGSEAINYAQVDSVNIFRFIDSILTQARNNLVHKFENQTDIGTWLKEQWAGLFREMISRRSRQRPKQENLPGAPSDSAKNKVIYASLLGVWVEANNLLSDRPFSICSFSSRPDGGLKFEGHSYDNDAQEYYHWWSMVLHVDDQAGTLSYIYETQLVGQITKSQGFGCIFLSFNDDKNKWEVTRGYFLDLAEARPRYTIMSRYEDVAAVLGRKDLDPNLPDNRRSLVVELMKKKNDAKIKQLFSFKGVHDGSVS